MNMAQTPIVVTMGDPAGVGPEITLKAFAARSETTVPWLWVGDPAVLRWTAQQLGLPLPPLHDLSPNDAFDKAPGGALSILSTKASIDLDKLSFGVANGTHAACVVESIETAAAWAMDGRVGGVVTPPINKAVLHAGGFQWPGHTELLGHCTGVHAPVMMLAGEGLRVVPATIHQSIRSVPDALSMEGLSHNFQVVISSLHRDFGVKDPKVAICALNPHAGEGGAFGDEESQIIEPAMTLANLGKSLEGPFPADALFSESARAPYDAIICMYHDQALIPIKMHCFGQATNITLGLPIIRTSVDHGTAYDIAGTGQAHHSALLTAVEQAQSMAYNRWKWQQERS
ncbi:4-hydroxythreonine-4-phosphate dehydrogenase PdxA [Magnetococcus sp. PR-3]|uniref:4-hydroxythreonine-4-phosphate dehydrogenase PdxA n=1 Tax=Magnetococcus sp. PR-3 TaxID=3120355 RepID=UPI002FCDFC2F